MDRKDEEHFQALLKIALEAEAEGDPFEMPVRPEVKPDRKMFKRLKLLMIYHSIQTVIDLKLTSFKLLLKTRSRYSLLNIQLFIL